MTDPWRFQRWAFETKTGNPVRKSVLSMLAMMADATTGRCEAKQDTLAAGVEVTTRAVSNHLRALREMGIIAQRPQFRVDRGRRGDEFLLLAPWVESWPDGQPIDRPTPLNEVPGEQAASQGTPPNDVPGEDRSGGTDPYSPRGTERSGQELPPRNTPSVKGAREDSRQKIPEDFPDELRPHARAAYKILTAVAAQHAAREVTPLALGRVIMARPRKPLVKAAHDLAAWAADHPVTDVVATYRNWLDNARTPNLAATERLDANGMPADPATNVTPLRRGGPAGTEPVHNSGDMSRFKGAF